MTDFERNYFGTGPRPATMTVASTSAGTAVGVPRKRGVLVRTNSNRDSQLTDEWQEQPPEEPLIPLTNGGGGARDGRTSSLRRPVLNGNSVSSANGVAVGSGAVVAAVKKEVNFVSPTKSDTEQPVKTHRRSDVKKVGEDSSTEQRLLHQQDSRLRRNSETEHSFEDQVLVHPARQRQLSSSSGADEDVNYETRNVDRRDRRQGTNYSSAIVSNSRRDSSRTGPQGTNGNSSSPHEKEQKCSTTDPSTTISGRDCDWNPAAEAISYYSDSTGSNSVTMPTVTTACAPGSGHSDTAAAAAIELDRMRRRPARTHASSWSLSSNCGGLSKAAIAHDDSRFGTIRSVQSECRTSSTSQLNRSGSLKRVKGRSNQSLCSCDAETEVRTETDGVAMKGH